MSEQLQRYFAAVLACVVAATWAASGIGPALAGLAAAVVGYAAVAFTQHRGVRQVERRPAAKPRRTKPTRARPRASEWPVFDADAELPGEQDAGAVPATGSYGW